MKVLEIWIRQNTFLNNCYLIQTVLSLQVFSPAINKPSTINWWRFVYTHCFRSKISWVTKFGWWKHQPWHEKKVFDAFSGITILINSYVGNSAVASAKSVRNPSFSGGKGKNVWGKMDLAIWLDFFCYFFSSRKKSKKRLSLWWDSIK